jgi:hypothetical protein
MNAQDFWTRGDVDAYSIENRVQAALDLAPRPDGLDSYQREAARWLWIMLHYLEAIAVKAADMGAGIAGQLEDELVHQELFRRLAVEYGGMGPAGPEIARMIHYIGALQGPIATVALNVVGEHWLERVFHNLATDGFGAEMFRTIEEDEHRHASEAMVLPVPDPTELAVVMPALERMLYDSAMSPHYLAPLAFMRGEPLVWKMGREAVIAHGGACRHLGVEPAACVRRLGLLCRTMLKRGNRVRPVRTPKTWRISAARLDDRPASIGGWTSIDLPAGDDHDDVEARVLRALYRTIEAHPELNVTYRAGRFYIPPRIKIGVRRRHSRGNIMTVYGTGFGKMTVAQVKTMFRVRAAALRKMAYEPVPELGELGPILPPSVAIAAVSYCGAREPGQKWATGSGIERGWTALLPPEGLSFSLGIGEPAWVPVAAAQCEGARIDVRRRVEVGITIDHRVLDGRHLALLSNGLRRYSVGD